MLYEPGRHEPLTDTPWNADRARAAIREIAADTETAMRSDGTWPWHPLDEEGAPEPPHKSLYLGGAGVLWALWALERSGFVALRSSPAAHAARLHDAYLAQPDTGAPVPSYFLGEAGILLMQWRLGGATDESRLAAVVAGNARNPTLEALWGAPGTMLAALHLHAATGEARWAELYRASAEALWETWLPAQDATYRLWTQDLYGRVMPLLGAGHGFAGNAFALLQGAHLLPQAMRHELHDRCVQTLVATAWVEGDLANWPSSSQPLGAPGSRALVQWCHGAPGIITSFAGLPRGRSREADGLLVRGGELTWRAGPLAKGPGLCHGTAGNGYAFLELHRRTGEARWLERARAFAMHAMAQSDQARVRHGRRRYSFWTGDPGLAVYLRDCIEARAGWPTLEKLE